MSTDKWKGGTPKTVSFHTTIHHFSVYSKTLDNTYFYRSHLTLEPPFAHPPSLDNLKSCPHQFLDPSSLIFYTISSYSRSITDLGIPWSAKAHCAQILLVKPDPDECDHTPHRPQDLGGDGEAHNLSAMAMGESTNNQK